MGQWVHTAGSMRRRFKSHEKYVQALQLRIAEQGERVEVVPRLIAEEMRAARVAAKQAREAVSRLRATDFADYQAEAQRKTQESLVEIASVQFARQQAAGSSERAETANRRSRAANAEGWRQSAVRPV